MTKQLHFKILLPFYLFLLASLSQNKVRDKNLKCSWKIFLLMKIIQFKPNYAFESNFTSSIFLLRSYNFTVSYPEFAWKHLKTPENIRKHLKTSENIWKHPLKCCCKMFLLMWIIWFKPNYAFESNFPFLCQPCRDISSNFFLV